MPSIFCDFKNGIGVFLVWFGFGWVVLLVLFVCFFTYYSGEIVKKIAIQ